jgi:ferredoxin-NADP reductase
MKASKHSVFISDDIGMASIFPKIKSTLSNQTIEHTTVLYYSSRESFLFTSELNILSKHFPGTFIVFFRKMANDRTYIQEDLEPIVNANTADEMNFIVSGGKEFIDLVEEILRFLDAKNVEIQEQFFSTK